MSIQVKFRRGTSTQHNSFTGANGEITVDTTNKTLRVHDGVTAGGVRLAKINDVNVYLQVSNASALFATKAYAAANSYVKSVLANTNSRINLLNTNLTGTNTAVRVLISDRLQVSNATTLLATKAPWSGITSTNTALRILINDRLQVANAATTYQTISTERAALANTNAYIATKAPWSGITSTNTALRTLISDRLQVANATTLLAAKATWNGLTSTNTALRTLISDRMQVANTNTLVNGRATWSALSGTNTALRTLVSDRLQVANAATIYQTKTIERAALANTNAFIKAQLANTNSYIASKISGPASSTNNAIVVFDGTTGKLTRDSLVTVGSTGAIVAPIASSVIPFHYDNQAAFPSATTYHGAIAHSHADGKMYFAHSGYWYALANNIDVNDRIQVANAAATYLTKNNPVVTGTLTANGSVGTSGYYLRTSGAGIYWSPVTAGGGGSAANGFSGILVGANVVSADSTTDRLTLVAGTGITIAADPTTDTITFTATGAGGGSSNSFSRITVGANTAIADSVLDTLTLVAGTGITIAANPTTDTITFASTGGFSGGTVANATTFSSGVTLSSTLTANGSAGTSGYYLRTSGTGVYWSPVSGGGGVSWSALTTTNTALRTLISDRLQVANAATLYTTKSNPTTSGVLAHTGRATISTNIAVTGNTTITGALINLNNPVSVTTNAGTVSASYRVSTFTNSSAAGMTITMSTTGAIDGQMTMVRIYDFSAAAQTITWVNTENSVVTVPTTSNASTTLPLTVGFMYNGQTTKWRCIASA